MKINEVLNQLNGYDAKENEELENIAATVLDLTKMYEEKSISDSEYKELLSDLQLEKSITMDASDLNAKAQLKFIIDTAITIAATAAKAI
jgi:hypothetical protein